MMSFAAGYAWPYIRQKALQPITITESPTEAAMTARLARMCVHSRVLAACMCVRHMPQCGDHMTDDTYCLEVIQVRIQVHSQTLRWGSRVCTWWCSKCNTGRRVCHDHISLAPDQQRSQGPRCHGGMRVYSLLMHMPGRLMQTTKITHAHACVNQQTKCRNTIQHAGTGLPTLFLCGLRSRWRACYGPVPINAIDNELMMSS